LGIARVPSKSRCESTGKVRHQRTTENSHIGHRSHTTESDNVKVQVVYHGN
jgi:hypothetical protein